MHFEEYILATVRQGVGSESALLHLPSHVLQLFHRLLQGNPESTGVHVSVGTSEVSVEDS